MRLIAPIVGEQRERRWDHGQSPYSLCHGQPHLIAVAVNSAAVRPNIVLREPAAGGVGTLYYWCCRFDSSAFGASLLPQVLVLVAVALCCM
eukprot:COSAG01_NODE_11781_length_1859_cov_42.632955_3_plen_91_part_00